MDRITIVNLALSRIGQSPIAALDEDSSPARSASLVYDSCRRAVLQGFPWSFATRTAHLNRQVEAPPDWRYSYSLPSDCLQAIRIRAGNCPDASLVQADDKSVSFVVRGRSLLANAPDVYLEYTCDATDEDQYDADFVDALVVRLASELAMPVGGKAELAQAFRQEYEMVVRRSSSRSAGQYYDDLPENPFLDARM